MATVGSLSTATAGTQVLGQLDIALLANANAESAIVGQLIGASGSGVGGSIDSLA